MTNRISASQFAIMLDHFQKYPQMLSGKVDPIFSKDTKDKRWEDLTSALNADGTEPAKSITQIARNRKDVKRKFKNSLAEEVSEKFIRSQHETNDSQRRMAQDAEKKVTLLEQQVALLERRAF
ncbi:hypothetical protein AVEN_123134-1 [Araneus ventricosus]|uniref:Regulatory protein zeste n=1 Tax=Araneus ventricosus TaxID=182803 RepID=A0A4Y2LGU5_ARAVE|nr:hypothetical protein AVEN_123134-1 [Araneus ventricosus]